MTELTKDVLIGLCATVLLIALLAVPFLIPKRILLAAVAIPAALCWIAVLGSYIRQVLGWAKK